MGSAPHCGPKRLRKAAGENGPASRLRPLKNAIESVSYFEFDRRVVARQLRRLWHEISAGAAEIEMVAAEGVFDRMLSHELKCRAQGLHKKADEIRDLHRLIIRAHPPGGRKARMS